MALIIVAVYDTEENGRSEYTEKTLWSLFETVDFRKHRLFISDNGSWHVTHDLYTEFEELFPNPENLTISYNRKNLGTAKAVNLGLKKRLPNEYIIKCDNDVVIHELDWVDQMEAAIERDNNIGIIGLKRKDLMQTPWHENPDFRSEPLMLSHESGQTWIMVEKSRDVMGTCTMLNHRLLDKIGGYFQGDGVVYSFDDSLINLRSTLAGFYNCFLPHIHIDHIDTGTNPYTQEKHKIASDNWHNYHKLHAAYCDGTRPLYEEI